MKTPKDGNERRMRDFEDFLKQNATPPPQLEQATAEMIQKRLRPRLFWITAKLFAAYGATALLALRVSPWLGIPDLHAYLEGDAYWSGAACTAIGGGLFIGASTLLAAPFLSRAEIRAVKKTKYAPVALLGAGSLLLFACCGLPFTAAYILAWLVSSLISGAAGFKIIGRARASLDNW